MLRLRPALIGRPSSRRMGVAVQLDSVKSKFASGRVVDNPEIISGAALAASPFPTEQSAGNSGKSQKSKSCGCKSSVR